MHGTPKPPLQVAGFIVSLALAGLAAGIHYFFFPGEWYINLDLPGWAPSNEVYRGTWAVLYFLMAVSAWVVWRHHGFFRNQRQLGFYLAQLALNALWPWVFFELQLVGLALTNMLVLWAVLVTTVILFSKRSRLASLLILPYLLWVLYVGLLNAAVWAGNL